MSSLRCRRFGPCSFGFWFGIVIPPFVVDFYAAVILIGPACKFDDAGDDAVCNDHVALGRHRVFSPAVCLNAGILLDGPLQVLGCAPAFPMDAALRIVIGFTGLLYEVAGQAVIVATAVQVAGVDTAMAP